MQIWIQAGQIEISRLRTELAEASRVVGVMGQPIAEGCSGLHGV